MSDARNPDRTDGCPALRALINIAREETPEKKLSTDDALRTEMGRFMASGAPAKQHFSAVVKGRRACSHAFLSALHNAFGFRQLGLSLSIWTVSNDRLQADFITPIREAREKHLDPLMWLRRIAQSAAGEGFEVQLQGGVLGIGFDRSNPGIAATRLELGQRIRLMVNAPFEGWLTCFNVHPDVTLCKPVVHWIDPPLRNVDKRRAMGVVALPDSGDGAPIGRPLGPNTLVVVLWSERPSFAWRRTQTDALEISEHDFRHVFLELLSGTDASVETQPAAAIDHVRVRVALFDYFVDEPPS